MRQYTLKEVAEVVQLKLATLQKEVTKGLLPTSKRGRCHVVSETDLRDWMLKRQQSYQQAPVRGQELTVKEACQLYSVSADVVRQGIKSETVAVHHLSAAALRRPRQPSPACLLARW